MLRCTSGPVGTRGCYALGLGGDGGCWRGSGLSYGHLEFFSETLELREWVPDGWVLGWNGRGGGGRIVADSSPGDSVALVGSGR